MCNVVVYLCKKMIFNFDSYYWYFQCSDFFVCFYNNQQVCTVESHKSGTIQNIGVPDYRNVWITRMY